MSMGSRVKSQYHLPMIDGEIMIMITGHVRKCSLSTELETCILSKGQETEISCHIRCKVFILSQLAFVYIYNVIGPHCIGLPVQLCSYLSASIVTIAINYMIIFDFYGAYDWHVSCLLSVYVKILDHFDLLQNLRAVVLRFSVSVNSHVL